MSPFLVRSRSQRGNSGRHSFSETQSGRSRLRSSTCSTSQPSLARLA
jgi:hypothetical protein